MKNQINLPFQNQYVGEYRDTMKNVSYVATLIGEEEIYVRGKGFDRSYYISVDHFLRLVKAGRFERVD